MKKVLITGSNGFIAKNLIEHLKRDENIKLYLYSKDDSISLLEAYIKEVDFIYHLAGINRPKNNDEFFTGNSELTKTIVDILIQEKKSTPILLSSSIQALIDNDYGKSKLEAENHLLEYSKRTDANVFIYRLPNVFGKWSKPNYNGVIATWCYNIANNLDIQVNDEKVELNLVYIDDVIKSFIKNLDMKNSSKYLDIETIYKKSLGEIRDLLLAFKENRTSLVIPCVASGFERALYATYLSYLKSNDFAYTLKGHQDDRGTFYEILKTLDSGQFSLSTTAPGITRGNHFHHTKNEKFLVVSGEGVIRFRKLNSSEIIEYFVSGEKMEVVDIPVGYTHNIENLVNTDMVTLMWVNEPIDPAAPDTYYLEV